jgi:predicted MPP superfamily phosphohydrolase
MILAVSGFLFWIFLRDAFIKKNGRLARWPIFSALALFAFAMIFLTVIYGSFIEPKIIIIKHASIKLTSSQEPLKIALISDLHAGPYKKDDFWKRVVKNIEKQSPDVVILDGDLVNGETDEAKYLAPFRELAQKTMIFAVLGNHDSGGNETRKDFYRLPEVAKTIAEYLRSIGINILENTGARLKIKSKEIHLGGVKEYNSGEANVAESFRGAEANFLKILLAHNPDIIFDAMREKIQLVLAAHTHAGQIRLPFYGSIHPPFIELGRYYFDKTGWFDFGNTKLYITSGIGETGARSRLFTPPEIVILDIY